MLICDTCGMTTHRCVSTAIHDYSPSLLCREDEIRKTTAAPLSVLRWTEHSKRVERPLDCKVIAAYDVVLVSGATEINWSVGHEGEIASEGSALPTARSSPPSATHPCPAGHTPAGLAAAHAQSHPLVRQAGRTGWWAGADDGDE